MKCLQTALDLPGQNGQPQNVPCSCSDGQPVFDVVASVSQNTTIDSSGGTNQFFFLMAPALVTEFTEVFGSGFKNLVVTASESTSSTSQCRYQLLVDPFTETAIGLPVVMSATGYSSFENYGAGNVAGDILLSFNSETNPGATLGLTSQGNALSTTNVVSYCDPSQHGPMSIRIQLFQP